MYVAQNIRGAFKELLCYFCGLADSLKTYFEFSLETFNLYVL